jgi:hypothetical protein
MKKVITKLAGETQTSEAVEADKRTHPTGLSS